MKKICVYTCITGSYDDVKEFKEFRDKNIDYYLFTNNTNIKSDFWNVVYIDNENLDNIRLNRKIKILGHELINNNYDYSIYIDGSIVLKKPIIEFVKHCCDFDNYDLIGFKHRDRDCIYDEAKACLKLMKDKKDIIYKEIEYIKSNNYPEHNGLMENTIIARNLKSKKVIDTCKLWFDMVLKYSYRDQLSFCYCAYKTKLKFKMLDMNVYDNEYFYNYKHKYKNQMNEYRFYFGDDDVVSNIDYELNIDGDYYKKGNHYIAKTISPCDTDLLKFTFGKFGMIKINNIKLNGNNLDYDFINGVELNNGIYFYSDYPTVVIKKNIKKNTKVSISFDMEYLTPEQIDTLTYELMKLAVEKKMIQNENIILKYERNNILNSKSWKVTKPIRFFTKLLKKGK